MGTRSLTQVIYNGQTKIAQYGQFDGYPEGQGKKIYQFLYKLYSTKEYDLDTFKDKLSKLRWLTDEEYEQIHNETLLSPVNIIEQKYRYLDRMLAGDILQYVYLNDDIIGLVDYSDFSYNFECDYVYLIDLDNNTFEVYREKELLKNFYLYTLPSSIIQFCDEFKKIL